MTTLNHAEEAAEISDRKPHPGRRMTEEEFVAWCDENTKAEWVDGEVVVMAPVSDAHSDINGFIISIMRQFVEHHDLGAVRGSEFQLRLGPQRRRRVPDVMFIAKARLNLLRKNHFEGPADLVMELVSAESEARDWREKYLEYQAAGVREYWIIDPNSQHVEAYGLSEEVYQRIAEKDDRINSAVLPGFYLRPSWLQQQPLPKVGHVLRELGVQG